MSDPREQEAYLRRVLGLEPYHTAERIEGMRERTEVVPEDVYEGELMRPVDVTLERCWLRREGCDECDLPPSRPQDDGSDPGVPF